MKPKDLSYLTIPDLIELARSVLTEIEQRCMEDAGEGETRRMVCTATGRTCVWCSPGPCPDRKPG